MVEIKTHSFLFFLINWNYIYRIWDYYSLHFPLLWYLRMCALRPNSTFSPASHDLVSSARAQGSFSVTLDWIIQTRSIAKKRSQFKKWTKETKQLVWYIKWFVLPQKNIPISANFLHCCSVLFIQQAFESCLCQALSGPSMQRWMS